MNLITSIVCGAVAAHMPMPFNIAESAVAAFFLWLSRSNAKKMEYFFREHMKHRQEALELAERYREL